MVHGGGGIEQAHRHGVQAIARLFERGCRVSVLVRGHACTRALSCKEAKTMQRNLVKILDKVVTNLKCMLTPTNLLVICSHRGMHANPGINEGGGGGGGGGGYSMYISRGLGACCRKILRFFMP